MSATVPISDPVASKKPSKDYPWWIENIDHRITPEVSPELIALILSNYRVLYSHSAIYRYESSSRHIAMFLQEMCPNMYTLS
jgi:hypothetical protein